MTTTYYLLAAGTCNTTSCVNTIVTVNTLSSAATSATAITPICIGNSTTLGITGGSLGTSATWNWYTGSCGGVYATNGTSPVLSPTVTTVYYLRAEGVCNTTACVNTTVVVNTFSTPATSATGTTPICLGNSTTLRYYRRSAWDSRGLEMVYRFMRRHLCNSWNLTGIKPDSNNYILSERKKAHVIQRPA